MSTPSVPGAPAGANAQAEPRSLFLVALPRSLSTLVHDLCAYALDLRSPSWARGGEILNGDQLVLQPESTEGTSRKFNLADERIIQQRIRAFLSDVVQPHGRLYRDVVQPFAVTRWLKENPMPTLWVRRPLADIAFSLSRQQLSFPARAGGGEGDELDQVLRGLVRARKALGTLGAEEIEFDHLVRDEEELRTALGRLYPDHQLPPLRYRNADFRRLTEVVLGHRVSREWLEIQERALRAEDAVAAEGS
ncbi:MAG: hypothetical protein AAGD01_10720 [Acidobacteriota bacterium]